MSEANVGILGSIVLVKSHDSSERLLMLEFVMPFLSKQSIGIVESLTSENARIPLIVLVVGLTGFYQLYWKADGFFNRSRKKQVDENGKPAGFM